MVIQEFEKSLRNIALLFDDSSNLDQQIAAFCDSQEVFNFVTEVSSLPLHNHALEKSCAETGKLNLVGAIRRLRGSYPRPLLTFVCLLSETARAFDRNLAQKFEDISLKLQADKLGGESLESLLLSGELGKCYIDYSDVLEKEKPHSLYPTSPFRESEGFIHTSPDDLCVEAVMACKTYTSIRIEENIFDHSNLILRDYYLPLGRCVCLLDENVETLYGAAINGYFSTHNISLHKLVYRGMEVDKVLPIVENILNDFKTLNVARHEPVLIIGGGVISDIGGLACALFNRNTPYIMIGSSIVSAIDAGPSPRTCCDGHGYKNLTGAYHAPVLAIADTSFFKTLKLGWLRHGVAEIIKMAIVKDGRLFEQLEIAGIEIVKTRFGTSDSAKGKEIEKLSKQILAGAMRSYVESEYENLFETHQCRPHAYGHTWSPGFELQSGLLHGHAVSIGMGLGAFLSWQRGWINQETLTRIGNLISSFELSLWHEILLDEELIWTAQTSVTDKRGGKLAAPVPKGEIGNCGYLNDVSREQLREGIIEYKSFCAKYPRSGVGLEPLCADVGLEDPSKTF